MTVAQNMSHLYTAHNIGQNLNTGISVFLIYETGIPVFQKQTLLLNKF
jgi:hypothetical protein